MTRSLSVSLSLSAVLLLAACSADAPPETCEIELIDGTWTGTVVAFESSISLDEGRMQIGETYLNSGASWVSTQTMTISVPHEEMPPHFRDGGRDVHVRLGDMITNRVSFCSPSRSERTRAPGA